MSKKKARIAGGDGSKKSPPLKLPIPFDKAVEGLLAIKPKPKEEKKGKDQ